MKPRGPAGRGADTLAAVGEFGFLKRMLPLLGHGRGVLVGPGDDCAVVRGQGRLVLTTDALVEGVHFERAWLEPEELGARAIAVNLSDVAAMGGRGLYAMMSVGVPGDYSVRALRRLHRGADRAARRAGACVVGGNVSAAPRLFVSVAMIGAVDGRPLLRSGARPGDVIFVTGTLGDAAAGVRLLEAGLRPGAAAARLIRRFTAPSPRLRAGARLGAAGVVSAMIDVSDGVARDLGHICDLSGVGAVVREEALPRSAAYTSVVGRDPALALGGGEDYELLFTVPPRKVRRIERLRSGLGCRVSAVGEIVARPRGVRVEDAQGRLRRPRLEGYEHFRVA